MDNPLKPILAGFEGTLAKFQRWAEERSGLLSKVRAMLPQPEQGHVVSAEVDAGVLIIAVDSAAWSTRLRYQEDALQRGWQTAGLAPFTKLRIKVGKPPVNGAQVADNPAHKE